MRVVLSTVRGNDFVVCCGTCAPKLKKSPERFLTL